MNKIIKTGEWDGQDIWREQTSAEKLSEALNNMSKIKDSILEEQEFRRREIEASEPNEIELERKGWLKEHSVTESDVLSDEDGEYIIDTRENGTAGEDGYSVDECRLDLPKHLQKND